MFDRIVIGKPLMRQHRDHVDEVVAVIMHELGHWKKRHMWRGMFVDTLYMVVFGLIYQFCVMDNAQFLLDFGFKEKSYFASMGLFVWLFVQTLDVPIKIVMNWI